MLGGRQEDNRALVADLNRRQTHRGPDHAGLWACAGVALGQTRLAVVDLSPGGHQPFHSDDGTITVVFNGEIYNHDDLRRRHALATQSRCDGAILPELWQLLGTAAFAELRGMFAIAVHDARDGTLTLARDPFGIKPLYWTRDAGAGLVFASEVRALLPLLSGVTIGRAALRRFLAFGGIGRDESPFVGVQSVPANGWRRWTASMSSASGTIRAGLLDALPPHTPLDMPARFLDSVSRHLVSDVPMALLLSSGFDSAALAWAGDALGADLTCLTVDLGGGRSESGGAAALARRFGHRHEIVSAVPDERVIDAYFTTMQRPSVDGLNVFLVSQAVASRGLRVALSGLGGDEVLAGYPSFRALRYLPLLRMADLARLTGPLARLLRDRHPKLLRLVSPAGPRDADALGLLFRRVLMDEQIATLLPVPESTVAAARGRDRSAIALARSEINGYLGGTLLPDSDAYSMAWSIEMRVPFVDVELVRACLAVDPERGLSKQRFAGALASRELIAISRRRKQGFSLPMDAWMRGGPLAAAVLAAESPGAAIRRMLRPAGIDRILAAWRAGSLPWSRAWSLVALNSWLDSLAAQGLGRPVLEEDDAACLAGIG